MTSFISNYTNPVEAYLKQSKSMIPLLSTTSYRSPVSMVRKAVSKRSRRRSRRKGKRKGRKKVRRNPKTGRFMKSK